MPAVERAERRTARAISASTFRPTTRRPPDLAALRASLEGGRVKALYVFDPGPSGIARRRLVDCRRRARADACPLLIVQGVVHSELTAAADFVLPGSTSFEKDASYTNDQGRVQGAAAVIAAPGDAQDDCLIFANFAMLFGGTLSTPDRARPEIAAELAHLPAYGALPQMTFSRPVAAPGVRRPPDMTFTRPVSAPAPALQPPSRHDPRRPLRLGHLPVP